MLVSNIDKTHVEERLKKLGINDATKALTDILKYIAEEAWVIIHFSVAKVLHLFVKDDRYRNQFETNTSAGTLCQVTRASWEDELFGKHYAKAKPVERVKYGVLNFLKDPRGVTQALNYGRSFLKLKNIKFRTTFAPSDTGGMKGELLATLFHYAHILMQYSDQELIALHELATKKVNHYTPETVQTIKLQSIKQQNSTPYRELQIHGQVLFERHVESLHYNVQEWIQSKGQTEQQLMMLLEEFQTKFPGVQLVRI